MPFVQRVVAPVHLSRVKLHDDRGVPTVRDRELDAVTNCALSNALRQMASVAALADEVFRELRDQLTDVAARSASLKHRVQALGHIVDHADPKAVTVPESDLTAFSLKTEHFKSKQVEHKNLLLAENRPIWIKRLYDQAGVPSKVYANKPLHVHRLSRRKRSLDDSCIPDDIELRKPAAINNLRPWTSEEVLGDITVAPDCSSRILRDPSPISEDQTDHKLPSPEEQLHVIALKFPPQIVEVDVSGRSFNRMSALRRSLQNVEYETTIRRRKSRRPRGKRRNTIAGTDQKELEAVIGALSDSNKDSDDIVSSSTTVVTIEKRSNLNLLKDWGRMRLKQLKNIESSTAAAVKLRDKGKIGLARRKWEKDEPVHSSSGNWSASSESGQSTSTSHVPRSSVSSCSGSTKPAYHGGSSVTSDEGETGSTYSCDTEGYYTSFHVDSGLKTLREEEPLQPMSALHSTSALTPSFQSSSAESEYDIFGRGSTSTTASSAGTVCTSLMVSPPNVPERSGSKLSEKTDFYGGSLPDRNIHGACIKDPMMYDKSKTAPSRLTKENVTRYKEEGLMIDVKSRPTLEHCGDSPDSGHNTCSSPVDSITNPSVDLEMSECSDLEGIDRVERLRVKTTINTSRIPSMCVITPPISDDEVSLKTLRALEADDYGEYVTLAHIMPEAIVEPTVVEPSRGYVHLSELPVGSLERKKATGARVTLNAEGKVIYTSDSLKRRKKIHTTNTFEPGPCVNANVQLTVNKKNIISQVIPRSPLNVRPVTKQLVFSAQHTVPSKKLLSENNTSSVVINQLKPLIPISLTCSPGQRRAKIAFPLTTAAASTNNVIVNRSQPSKVVLPENNRSLTNSGKPVSPLISPTRRSLSPKEVVKGAYVRMQDPTDCLETSLDDMKSVVKRSDSYRQANANSPRLAKSPNMLMSLQKTRSENAQGTSCDTPQSPTLNENYSRGHCDNVTDKQNVSASTPVKNDRSAGRIDMSSNNISPIHDYRSSPAERLLPVTSPTDRHRLPVTSPTDRHRLPVTSPTDRHRLLPVTSPTDRHRLPVTSPTDRHRLPVTSPTDRHRLPVTSPTDRHRLPVTSTTDRHGLPTVSSISVRGPSAAAACKPFVPRSFSGRSAMDLYAAIHESKKRLLGGGGGGQQPPAATTTAVQKQSPPRPQSSNRHRSRGGDERSARYDFKRLLLQTNMAGGRRAQQSAVVRLQQPTPPPLPVVRGGGPAAIAGRRGPTSSPLWKSNVLSSTIQEDCREDEDDFSTTNGNNDGVLKSAALVNRTLKNLSATTTSYSTLETAL